MTTGDEPGKSNVFLMVAAALFPLAEEAMRREMTLKEFECGLLGGLLCIGKRVVDPFLIALGDGDPGESDVHPDDSGNAPYSQWKNRSATSPRTGFTVENQDSQIS